LGVIGRENAGREVGVPAFRLPSRARYNLSRSAVSSDRSLEGVPATVPVPPTGGHMMKKVMGMTLVALLAGSWAGADWLVWKDGSKIRTRGAAVVVDGEVGYFDLTGQIRRFPAMDLDINATKLTNIAAKRKRVAGEDHFVIDDDQVGHVDPDMAAAI